MQSSAFTSGSLKRVIFTAPAMRAGGARCARLATPFRAVASPVVVPDLSGACKQLTRMRDALRVKWVEPSWGLLASQYYPNCCGSAYAVSQAAAAQLGSFAGSALRYLANEDTMMVRTRTPACARARACAF